MTALGRKRASDSCRPTLEPGNEPHGSRNRIQHVLVRTKHLSGVKTRRVEQWKINNQGGRGPTRIFERPSFDVVRNQLVLAGVPVIIERNLPVSHEDVISRNFVVRLQPNGTKTIVWKLLEKHTRQNVTGAMTKENPIGKPPSTNRVVL